MKYNKTRHFMEELINQVLKNGNHLNSTELIFAHYTAALKELLERERLAEIGAAVKLAINKGYEIFGSCEYICVDTGKEEIELLHWYRKEVKE